MCAGATITPKVVIGNNSIVGAGATVLADAEANSVYTGTPAKKLRDLR